MNIGKRLWFLSGGSSNIVEPTESDILAYIMANFPPDLMIDPEVGISDASGNGVTITTAGSPTLNASGGPNNRAYIELDGVDDVIISDRVDIGTQCMILKQGAVNNQMILNVPTTDTGSGDNPKFYKQGILCRSSSPLVFQFYPDSGGTKLGIRAETGHVNGTWQTLLHRGDDYAYKNGQHFGASTVTAVANTTVTKMFFGAWGYGNGTNINSFTEYDLGLYMSWNAELTDDQLYIVNAYLELRGDTYGNKTYLYKAGDFELEATNPVLAGSSVSGTAQSYGGTILTEGQAYSKSGDKEVFNFNTPDSDFLNWTDGLKVLDSTSSTFDELGINEFTIIKYGSTYYMLYAGRDAGNLYNVGLASSSDPEAVFDKPLGNNPIILRTDINTAIGKTYSYIAPNAVIPPNGSQTDWIVFIHCLENNVNGNFGDIVKCSGADLENLDTFELVLSHSDSPIKFYSASHTAFTDPLGYTQQVRYIDIAQPIRYRGKIFSWACVAKVVSDEPSEVGSTRIFPLVADDDGQFNFKLICSPVTGTGLSGTWDATQRYLPQNLVSGNDNMTPYLVNNKNLMYFSGFGIIAQGINTLGQEGYAYFQSPVSDLLT